MIEKIFHTQDLQAQALPLGPARGQALRAAERRPTVTAKQIRRAGEPATSAA